MPGRFVVARMVFLFGSFFLLAFTAFVIPSSASGSLRIKGIMPSSTYSNDTVLVCGVGATPGARVTAMLVRSSNSTIIVGNGTIPWVDLSSGNLTVGSAVSGNLGDWQIGFLVPNVLPGAYVVYVSDEVSSDVMGLEVLMKVIPVPLMTWESFPYLPFNITFSASNLSELPLLFFFSGNVVPASGPPGSLVSMSGRFASGGQIVLYFDDAYAMTVAGQKSGDWSASFIVPYVSAGVHTVRAIDVEGRWMSTASFYVISSGVGSSISSLVLFGFLAIAALSGSVALMLLFVSHRRKRN